jgi:OOP family OmpA-OmpF porin
MERKIAGLVAGLMVAATLAPAAASAQVYVVPAPRARYERIPPPRRGMQWHPGYWRWGYGSYVWVPGAWAPVVVVPGAYYPQQVVVVQQPPPPRVERLSADALFPFDRGSVKDIRPQGMADIGQIAARLRSQPFDHVEVDGYTDRLGGYDYNLNLSQRRADAVRDVLISQGVPAGQIRAVGFGSQKPLVQCSGGNVESAALIRCLQPNRRVEIVTYLRS